MEVKMANVLTGIRIVCGLLILAFPAYSKFFYIFYLLGGFTDAIDGTVARKLGKETEFGAKFDTAADIIFVLSAIIKVIVSTAIPIWILIWIGVLFTIKVFNIIVGFIKQHKFVVVHSVLNRVTGVITFITLPLLAGFLKTPMLILACGFATVAAINEWRTI